MRVGCGIYKEIRNPIVGTLIGGAVSTGHLAFGSLLVKAAMSQATTGASIATGGVGAVFLATGLLVSNYVLKKDWTDVNHDRDH